MYTEHGTAGNSPIEPKKLYRAGSLEEGKSGWENWRDQFFGGVAFRMTTKCQMAPAMYCTYLSQGSCRLPKANYLQPRQHSQPQKSTQQPKKLHLFQKTTHSTFDWTTWGGDGSSCPKRGEWQLQHTQHRLSPPLASAWRDLEGVNPWSTELDACWQHSQPAQQCQGQGGAGWDG